MNRYEEEVAKGTAKMRRAGLIAEDAEVFMPDVPTIMHDPAPLSQGAKIASAIQVGLMTLVLIGVLGGIAYSVYAGFFAADSVDSYLATRLLFLVVSFMIVIFVGGAIMGLLQLAFVVVSMFFKSGVREKFVRVVEDEYGASPKQYLERGWSLDSYEFYGLDVIAGTYFDYGAMNGWEVRSVPLCMVQRYEHMRNTETTVTTEVTSTNRLRTSSSSRSEHTLRLHVVDVDGTPIQISVPFGSDEAHLQTWVTALNTV